LSAPRTCAVRVEQRHQRGEVAVARRREERVDDTALTCGIGLGTGRGTGHPAPGPTRELPRRCWGSAHDRRDLVERHREQVVQHEREALGRIERVEHDE
jgi:hypothetical protein